MRLFCSTCFFAFSLPARLPLLYSPSPLFSPALPRSRSRACHASAPADPSRAGSPGLQRQHRSEFHDHDVGDCCWVARPSWASRWVSAVANSFATACSRTPGLSVEAAFRGRSVRPLHAVGMQSGGVEGGAAKETLQTNSEDDVMQARQGGEPGARADGAEQQQGKPAAGDTDEDAIAQAIAAEVDRRGRGDRRGETGGGEGGESLAKSAGEATKANRFVVLLAVEAASPAGDPVLGWRRVVADSTREARGSDLARAATRTPSELRVRLGTCVVEGMQMDGIARWGEDGRVWGILLDREEFWYRSVHSTQPRGRDAKPSAVLQLYLHLVTRLGRSGVAIVRRQNPPDVADLEVIQTSSAM
ncbi:UNVERIFIED_CONTAM: hypothetical protein HHA_462260 [Hammondia hammondi]|eukprot:XP_008885076.1 hypothetical protein HHA_462260 [Hammondia hammondi]